MRLRARSEVVVLGSEETGYIYMRIRLNIIILVMSYKISAATCSYKVSWIMIRKAFSTGGGGE